MGSEDILNSDSVDAGIDTGSEYTLVNLVSIGSGTGLGIGAGAGAGSGSVSGSGAGAGAGSSVGCITDG